MGNGAARFTMLVAFAALTATQMLAAGNAPTYRVSIELLPAAELDT